MQGEIKTTGQLRTALAHAAKSVIDCDMDIDRAIALHKIAKNISDSLYFETKIAMFRSEVGEVAEEFGTLPLGDPNDAKVQPGAATAQTGQAREAA